MKKSILLVALLGTVMCTSCAEKPFKKQTSLAKLADKYAFKMGTCISWDTVGKKNYQEMVINDYNTITATNEFKAYSLLNQQACIKQNKPVMNYQNADKIAEFAQTNGIGVRGHVLVWDAYMGDWFFREGFKRNGEFVSKEVMEERLKYYITEVVTHFETKYPGVVYCWDVVNEAVADGANEWIPGNPYHIRKTRSGTNNVFYQVMGEEYVYFAFKCARDVVNSLGCDIKLFYNDYNTFYRDKRDAIIRLVNHLNENERLCDGVGMQGYIGGYGQQNGCMNPGDLSLIKQAIKMYSDLGVEVQLTEVAVRNYKNDEEIMKKHALFYGELIRTIIEVKKEGANFTGLTIWGIADNPSLDKNNYSYKMNGPYCGLYDSSLNIKESYKEVYKALK